MAFASAETVLQEALRPEVWLDISKCLSSDRAEVQVLERFPQASSATTDMALIADDRLTFLSHY